MSHRMAQMLALLVLTASSGIAAPAGRAATTDSVALQWNAAALQAIRDTHPGPPMCARDLAIVSTCMYDAWAAYDATALGTRFGNFLRCPSPSTSPATAPSARPARRS